MHAYMRFRAQVDTDGLVPNADQNILHGLRDSSPGRVLALANKVSPRYHSGLANSPNADIHP